MTRSTTPPDLAHPGLYADGMPHELLRELRRTSPVVWVDEPATDGLRRWPGYWAVLRHADVSHVSRHPEDFSSWRGTSFLRDPRPSDVAVLRRMMLNMDPPEHSSLRRIVNKAFTPQAIRRQLASSIERHARAVVDAVCERGEIDFLTDVAAEMPLLVLADVLGRPQRGPRTALQLDQPPRGTRRPRVRRRPAGLRVRLRRDVRLRAEDDGAAAGEPR